MTVTGAVNAVAGVLGTIGPVDFSLSPGVIAASGCGSRHPLIPAAGFLLLASFSPALLGLAGAIPQTVVGALLLYTLSGQVAAGLGAALGGDAFVFVRNYWKPPPLTPAVIARQGPLNGNC